MQHSRGHDNGKHPAATDVPGHRINLRCDHAYAEANQRPADYQQREAHKRDGQVAKGRAESAEAYDRTRPSGSPAGRPVTGSPP